MNPKGRYRIQSPVRLRIPAFPESGGDSVLVFLFLQSAWPIRHAFSLPPQIVRKGHHFSAGTPPGRVRYEHSPALPPEPYPQQGTFPRHIFLFRLPVLMYWSAYHKSALRFLSVHPDWQAAYSGFSETQPLLPLP